MVLRSAKYNDVYFSTNNGLAETNHVFINGNSMAEAWRNRNSFVTAETGFGTGLNFLATWKMFEETAPKGNRLHFISVEKHPLSKDEIYEALKGWRQELGAYIDKFLAQYPIRVPGPHIIHLSSSVSLTVWFGDIADVLPAWQGFQVDAWYLDGFTPAKNPDMWTDELYAHMARLSHGDTTFASFTAAGHVRRGLEAAGFEVQKAKGYGHKRDMIHGRFISQERIERPNPRSIAIIGGGLAGCAMAYAARLRGMKAVIYEANDDIAQGASAGKMGMVNPKLTAKPTPHADYYTAAYAHALRVLSQFEDIDFIQNGSLHLCTSEDKHRRFTGYIDNLGWHEDHIQRVGGDLFYPDAASVSPASLCRALAQGANIKTGQEIKSIKDIEEDIIVIASGYAVNDLLGEELPVHSVRGQVSWIKPQDGIDKNICYGGYITPQSSEGVHVLGATFQPWEADCDLKEEDHMDNLANYNAATGGHLTKDDIVGGWAALRASSRDRFPVVGSWYEGVYLSVAHGSHGIISGLMAAEIIMAQVTGMPVPASRAVLKALSPKRFC